MDVDPEPQVEPVFIAANVAEAEAVERLLEREGIEFEVRPEAFLRSPLPGTCFQGLLFEVLAGQAEYCRHVLAGAGLTRGVLPPAA
jgi:hypothetical protein